MLAQDNDALDEKAAATQSLISKCIINYLEIKGYALAYYEYKRLTFLELPR